MTKLPLLLAAALVATAGAASADNAFDIDRQRSSASSLALTNVEADRPGSIQVFAYSRDGVGVLGRHLGSAPIDAGSTGDVAVPLSEPADGRLVIFMMNGNHSVTKMITSTALTN